LARRKKKTRRSRKITIPLSIIIPMAWKVKDALIAGMNGDLDSAMDHLLWHFASVGNDIGGAGYHFNTGGLWTWLPVLAGGAIHKWVGGPSGLNVNRYLKDVPLIRV